MSLLQIGIAAFTALSTDTPPTLDGSSIGATLYILDTGEKSTWNGGDWVPIGSGVPEAPEDDKVYIRRDGAWANMVNAEIKDDYVKTDLFLNLDAGDIDSYPGTGTEWYDISPTGVVFGGGTTGTPIPGSFPIWQSDNGGRFYYDGTKTLSAFTGLSTITPFTVDVWFYRLNNATRYGLFEALSGVPDNWWITNIGSNFSNIYQLSASDPSGQATTSNWWGRWVNFIITSDVGGSALWVDGVLQTSPEVTISNSLPGYFGDKFVIGSRHNGSNPWNGYFSMIKGYSKVLTPSEIAQNYNASKYRFE